MKCRSMYEQCHFLTLDPFKPEILFFCTLIIMPMLCIYLLSKFQNVKLLGFVMIQDLLLNVYHTVEVSVA
jgi:hypothetical protein